MKKIVFLFTMSFLLCTCTKFGKNVTIKGRVLNPITGAGIPNIEIWLQKPTNGLPGGLKTIKKATTDVNGNYEIDKFSLSANSAICALPASGEYYPIGWKNSETGENMGSPTLKIKKGKTMHVDFHAVPYGQMKYTIKNVSCFDESDTLFLTRRYQLANTFYKDNLNKSQYIGCFQYVGQVYSKYPMGWHYIDGYYKKNNVITTLKDSIFINENQQYEWIFEY